jgi:hypothetical protein
MTPGPPGHFPRPSMPPPMVSPTYPPHDRARAQPSLRLPSLRLPSLRLPSLRLPSLCLPSLRLPSLRLPSARSALMHPYFPEAVLLLTSSATSSNAGRRAAHDLVRPASLPLGPSRHPWPGPGVLCTIAPSQQTPASWHITARLQQSPHFTIPSAGLPPTAGCTARLPTLPTARHATSPTRHAPATSRPHATQALPTRTRHAAPR